MLFDETYMFYHSGYDNENSIFVFLYKKKKLLLKQMVLSIQNDKNKSVQSVPVAFRSLPWSHQGRIVNKSSNIKNIHLRTETL